MVFALMIAAAPAPAAQGAPAAAGPVVESAASPEPAGKCTSQDAAEIVVCRERNSRYRIDPSVLQAFRVREGAPAQPQQRIADLPATSGCIGLQACKGDTVPLVKMGLAAARAVALAVEGEDWREAFRSKPDEYRLYQDAKARRTRERRVTIGIGAGK